VVVVELLFFMFMGCSVAALFAAITKTFATGAAIIHISIWNVSFSILIGQNSVAEWLSG
jgi:hypothetical protein